MVVIVGTGIAGAATAYYLCRHKNPPRVTMIDAVGPAACASGTAGAYISSHWGAQTKREALFRESFALHEQLAVELSMPLDYVSAYREVDIQDEPPGVESSLSAHRGKTTTTILPQTTTSSSSWMDHVNSFDAVPGKSAIVNPLELTKAMINDAVTRGRASLVINTVSTFDIDKDNKRVTGIQFQDNRTLQIDQGEDIVLAMGPWSSQMEDWFHTPMPIDGVLSTSLIYTRDDVDADADDETFANYNTIVNKAATALFCKEDINGCHLEVLPRASVNGNSLYVSGCGGSTVSSPEIFRSPRQRPWPQDSCYPNMARAKAAQKSLATLLTGRRGDVSSSIPQPDSIQACIRPVAPDGMPVIGKLSSSFHNVYVVTGGGPWGITWGPLMGYCMAHVLLDGPDDLSMPVRLATYTPHRFDTLLYRTLLEQRKTSLSV